MAMSNLFKKREEDFYICMLRYAKANLENGVNYRSVVKHLKEKGFNIPEENSTLLAHYFPMAFYSTNNDTTPPFKFHYFLKPDAYMHLVTHDEMVQARKSAIEARIFAIIAIGLSVYSIVKK